MSVKRDRVDEGDNLTFVINTKGIAAGSLLDYNLNGTGLTPADVGNASLSGKLVVDRSGKARITFRASKDLLTEGPEAVSLNVIQASTSTASTFGFETLSSRNPDFDRSPYTYPTGPLAGQVNPNTGDVRLDGIVINGVSYSQDQLQLASAATIVSDTAVDPSRGGGNLTTGYGIGATDDPWVAEGLGSTTPTPTSADIRAAHANFNLTSIAPIRENVGIASYELSFDNPTNTLLLWERGNSGDILVEALDRNGAVVGEILVLDGANDGLAANAYRPTGITVTTFVNPTFLNQGQELASVGLRFELAVTTFRFTAIQQPAGPGAVRYNGPDLKVLALDSSEASTIINDPRRTHRDDPIIGGEFRALDDQSIEPEPGFRGSAGFDSHASFQILPLIPSLGDVQVKPQSPLDVPSVPGIQENPLVATYGNLV